MCLIKQNKTNKLIEVLYSFRLCVRHLKGVEMMEKVYYTVKEFAAILCVCDHTVRDAIKCRKIIGVRLNPSKKSPYRIHYSQLEKLLAESTGEEE